MGAVIRFLFFWVVEWVMELEKQTHSYHQFLHNLLDLPEAVHRLDALCGCLIQYRGGTLAFKEIIFRKKIQVGPDDGEVGIGLIDNLGDIFTICTSAQDLDYYLVFAPAPSHHSILQNGE